MNNEIREALRQELERLRANGARRQELSHHACTRLFFDFGIRPSTATVRDLTQTGSASDIPKDIDAFWSHVRAASKVRIEGGALPEALRERAGELLGQLFAEAQDHARAALAVQQEQIQTIVEASEERIRDAEVRHAAIDEARERSEARAATATARVATLEAELAVLRGQETNAHGGLQALIHRLERENDALSKRLEAEQAASGALRERIDALQDELRHSTEHYAHQIKDAVTEAERRVKPMLVELDSLRSMAATYQAGVREASQKEFEFIQQLSASKARADRFEAQVRAQSDEIDALAHERDTLRARAGMSEEVGAIICALATEGRLSADEIDVLGTDIDAHVEVPARCPVCEAGEPEMSRHDDEYELSCPDCEHTSGTTVSRLAALVGFCRQDRVKPA
ncbi:plasmid replication DNA-binding protein KfrA [Paraburkholderia sp. BL8N3]|jgi:DNA repair exonuclease SbcCD ATPase subunit|nr:DNA-binding protein [Paraburkholderia sp. BL8N3]TCK38479.1 plasmid replication DNA-binding protein KfrA [Paraburkholderia sp. BL8N3]